MIRELLAVGGGGALGCMARYLISTCLLSHCTLCGFPLGTFTVNVLGSLLIGFFMRMVDSHTLSLLLTVGFCGGFTTFSTFSADAVRLLRAGDMLPALAYIGASIVVCMTFTLLGMWLGTTLKN